MTFIDLFKNYWVVNRNNQMPAACATLYFYLLQECNVRRWIDNFSVSMRSLTLTLGMSRDTIYTAREILKKRGLIDFQKGQGSASALYTILGVKDSKKKFVSAETTKTSTQTEIESAEATQIPTQNPTQTEIESAEATQIPTQNPTQTEIESAEVTQTPTQIPTQTPTQIPTQTPTQTENTPINIFKDINKTKKDINKTKKDIKTVTYIDVAAGEKILEKFFEDLKNNPTGWQSKIMFQNGIVPEDVEEFGGEIIEEWIARNQTHDSTTDMFNHFISTLKIKRNISRRERQKADIKNRAAEIEQPPTEADYAFSLENGFGSIDI